MADNTKKFLDGKSLSERLRKELAQEVRRFREARGVTPGLAVCLIGENPASQIYVRKKKQACVEAGMASFEHSLPAQTSITEILDLLDQLNADPNVHGILVQLPLPAHIDADQIMAHIAPHKDVDGFHPQNVGLLQLGKPRFVPCTPLGVMKLLEANAVALEGMHAVVVGRSNIVGKPIAALLLQANASVSLCHSRTRDLPAFLSQADLVVAAIGRPQWIKGEHLKNGAVVIDVGINRLESGKLVGDVDFASALPKVSLITPVPGGVGPMTIACLLHNTLQAAKLNHAKEK